ncbi:MAG: aminotransferase class V-fold PLP-dependent enzyme [Zavarzinella sp.]
METAIDPNSDRAWAAATAQMIQDPTIVNLNTGSFGPLPRSVFERGQELRRQLAAEPTHFFIRQLPDLLWEARTALADYLGTFPAQLVFTSNVSCAINLVASGLRLSSPGEILLTDHEYGAMHWCWQRAARRQGLTFRTFPLPHHPVEPQEIVDAAVKAMTRHTRLLFFSHVLSPTGMVLPAQQLCAAARERGIISVVDGAHAPAMIPLNVSHVGADYYTGNCHKWLLAPSGAGFLAATPGMAERLEPLQVSWGYYPDQYPIGTSANANADRNARDQFGSTPNIRHLEFEGTRDPVPWLCIPQAIAFQETLGRDRIRQRIAALVQHTRVAFAGLGLLPATPIHPEMHGSLTGFHLPWTDRAVANPLREAIWKHRIEVPIIERPDRLMIRISTHFYNQTHEIDQLVGILPAIFEAIHQSRK